MTEQRPGSGTALADTSLAGITERAEIWLMRRGKHEPDLADPETAWGRCLIETERFVEYVNAVGPDKPLRLIRITGQHYPGRVHWAVIVLDEDAPEESPVVDVTLRQFLPDAPVPWSGTLVEWYDDVIEGISDYLNVEVYDDPQADPIWTDDYARDDIEPGDVEPPWRWTKADDQADDQAAQSTQPGQSGQGREGQSS